MYPTLVLQLGKPDLFQHVESYIVQMGRIKEKDLARVSLRHLIRQLVDCVDAVHASGRVWCDCKPANFVRRPNTTTTSLFAIDFELAVAPGQPVLGGSKPFMPPEFFSSTRQQPLKADFSLDMWSLGVTVLVLLSPAAKN